MFVQFDTQFMTFKFVIFLVDKLWKNVKKFSKFNFFEVYSNKKT